MLFPSTAAAIGGPLKIVGSERANALFGLTSFFVLMTIHSIGLSFAYRYALLAPANIQKRILNKKGLFAYCTYGKFHALQ
jgi:hypothetical protein